MRRVCHTRRPLHGSMSVIGSTAATTSEIGGLNFVWFDAPKKAKKQIPDHLLDACGAMTQILRITCAGKQRK